MLGHTSKYLSMYVNISRWNRVWWLWDKNRKWVLTFFLLIATITYLGKYVQYIDERELVVWFSTTPAGWRAWWYGFDHERRSRELVQTIPPQPLPAEVVENHTTTSANQCIAFINGFIITKKNSYAGKLYDFSTTLRGRKKNLVKMQLENHTTTLTRPLSVVVWFSTTPRGPLSVVVWFFRQNVWKFTNDSDIRKH